MLKIYQKAFCAAKSALEHVDNLVLLGFATWLPATRHRVAGKKKGEEENHSEKMIKEGPKMSNAS